MLDTVAARAARKKIMAASVEGLDHPALLATVSAALREAVPFDAAGWCTTDPATLLPIGGYSDSMPEEACLAYFDNELLQPDVNKFRDLVRGPGTGLLSQATGGELRRSPRYRTMMQPFGHERELRFAMVADGGCWGTTCLVRDGARPEFSPKEVAFVASLGRHIAHGLRAAGGPAVPALPVADGPGIIVLDDALAIVSLTAAAEHWLGELAEALKETQVGSHLVAALGDPGQGAEDLAVLLAGIGLAGHR
ncbi:MAG: hypothetical protein HZB46_01945, partial [Solirubrobacterales bacterium]|nr:hypothetical protein [Solirubrobacterales bacterium]